MQNGPAVNNHNDETNARIRSQTVKIKRVDTIRLIGITNSESVKLHLPAEHGILGEMENKVFAEMAELVSLPIAFGCGAPPN